MNEESRTIMDIDSDSSSEYSITDDEDNDNTILTVEESNNSNQLPLVYESIEVICSQRLKSSIISSNGISPVSPVVISEYLVSLKNLSLIHAQWVQLELMIKHMENKKLMRLLNQFHLSLPIHIQKLCKFNTDKNNPNLIPQINNIEIIFKNCSLINANYYDSTMLQIDYIVTNRNSDYLRGNWYQQPYLVKWNKVDREFSTWETLETIVNKCGENGVQAIQRYHYYLENFPPFCPNIPYECIYKDSNSSNNSYFFNRATYPPLIPLKLQDKSVNPLKLIDFQTEGVNWMYERVNNGLNCILADDVASGKSIQICALLNKLYTNNNTDYKLNNNTGVDLSCPILIISPSGGLNRWSSLLSQYCSSLFTLVYSGSNESRHLIRTNRDGFFTECMTAHNPEQFICKGHYRFHVLLTTFENLQSDIDIYFKRIRFSLLIFDEAERLKSADAICSSYVKQLHYNTILMLLTEPVVYHENELINLMQQYKCDNTSIKRRTQWDKDCFNYFSDEILVSLEMTELQREIYRRVIETDYASIQPKQKIIINNSNTNSNTTDGKDIPNSINNESTDSEINNNNNNNNDNNNHAHINNENNNTNDIEKKEEIPTTSTSSTEMKRSPSPEESLTPVEFKATRAGHLNNIAAFRPITDTLRDLRRCCIHPNLMDANFCRSNSILPINLHDLAESSCKFLFLTQFLPSLIQLNQRIIITGWSSPAIDLLYKFLIERFSTIPIYRINTDTIGKERQKQIELFEKYSINNNNAAILIISMKCLQGDSMGVAELNANSIILLESQPNMQLDLLGLARYNALRVFRNNNDNQKQPRIQLYRLLCKDSIEAAITVKYAQFISDSLTEKGKNNNNISNEIDHKSDSEFGYNLLYQPISELPYTTREPGAFKTSELRELMTLGSVAACTEGVLNQLEITRNKMNSAEEIISSSVSFPIYSARYSAKQLNFMSKAMQVNNSLDLANLGSLGLKPRAKELKDFLIPTSNTDFNSSISIGNNDPIQYDFNLLDSGGLSSTLLTSSSRRKRGELDSIVSALGLNNLAELQYQKQLFAASEKRNKKQKKLLNNSTNTTNNRNSNNNNNNTNNNNQQSEAKSNSSSPNDKKQEKYQANMNHNHSDTVKVGRKKQPQTAVRKADLMNSIENINTISTINQNSSNLYESTQINSTPISQYVNGSSLLNGGIHSSFSDFTSKMLALQSKFQK